MKRPLPLKAFFAGTILATSPLLGDLQPHRLWVVGDVPKPGAVNLADTNHTVGAALEAAEFEPRQLLSEKTPFPYHIEIVSLGNTSSVNDLEGAKLMLSTQVPAETILEVTSYQRIEDELLQKKEELHQLVWGEKPIQAYSHLSRMATLQLQLKRWQDRTVKRSHLDEMKILILNLDSKAKEAVRHLAEKRIEDLHASGLGPRHPAVQENERIAAWTTIPTPAASN
ncbi:hypothetical protein AAFN60_10055 [Roseibacillus persicicus]|uniref:hypothetical protein n=1 Tax=Roseibacillus persicicus TaxID=454148 RepID=UPI00398A7325